MAIDLASKVNGELISADSRQIYKYMEIGTGQTDNPKGIHLTNFIDPNDSYSVSKWQKAAYYLIDRLLNEGKTPIVVGGTGLYIDSLLYQRDYGNNLFPLTPIEFCLKTPEKDRKSIYDSINKRVEYMFEIGFVDEVKNLIALGYKHSRSVSGAGYKEIIEYLENEGKSIQDFPEILNSKMPLRPPILTFDECKEKVKIAYRNYAKRQFTWFRKYYEDFEVHN